MGNIHWMDIFTCTDFADLYISNTRVLWNVHISWHKYQYFQCTQAFQHSPCLGLLQLWQQPLLCHLLHGYWNPGWCGLQVITHIFIFHIIPIQKNCHLLHGYWNRGWYGIQFITHIYIISYFNLHEYWNPDGNKYFLSSYNNLSYRQVQTIQKFSSGPAYSFTEGEADVTAVPGINNVIFWSTMSSFDQQCHLLIKNVIFWSTMNAIFWFESIACMHISVMAMPPILCLNMSIVHNWAK